jgi:hypothetical protein
MGSQVSEGLSSHYNNGPETFQHARSWVTSDGAEEQDASWGCVGMVLLVVLLAVLIGVGTMARRGRKGPPMVALQASLKTSVR